MIIMAMVTAVMVTTIVDDGDDDNGQRSTYLNCLKKMGEKVLAF